MRTLAQALLLLVAAAGASIAGEPDPRVKARAHFKAGNAYYEAAAYDAAANEYLQAYRLLPSPDFLFNIGQAHRLRGDKRAALEHYRRYVELAPDGRAAAESRDHITALAAALAAEPAPAPAPPTSPPAVEVVVTPAAAPPPAAPAPAPARSRSRRAGWAALGVSAVALVGGAIVIGVVATSPRAHDTVILDLGAGHPR